MLGLGVPGQPFSRNAGPRSLPDPLSPINGDQSVQTFKRSVLQRPGGDRHPRRRRNAAIVHIPICPPLIYLELYTLEITVFICDFQESQVVCDIGTII